MKDFIVLSRVNYTCMTLSQGKFVLPNLPIAMNLSKYEKVLQLISHGLQMVVL